MRPILVILHLDHDSSSLLLSFSGSVFHLHGVHLLLLGSFHCEIGSLEVVVVFFVGSWRLSTVVYHVEYLGVEKGVLDSLIWLVFAVCVS